MPHPLERDLNHILAHAHGVWDALHGQRLFITGGTGFVGTWLVESFAWANAHLKLGSYATVLTRDPDSFRRKCPNAANDKSVDLLRGNAVSFDFPDSSFAFVIHAATERGFEPSKASLTDRFCVMFRRPAVFWILLPRTKPVACFLRVPARSTVSSPQMLSAFQKTTQVLL